MQIAIAVPAANTSGRHSPIPCLIVGLAWFAFLMIALKVRIIEAVFLWVMTQGLLVERVAPIEGGWWISRGILLAAYMGAGLIAWWIVERPGRDPVHVWRRGDPRLVRDPGPLRPRSDGARSGRGSL